MNYLQKIRRLYAIAENENFGFDESEIIGLERRLNIALSTKLKEYYLTLGKNENVNFSHNRLLKPDKEIDFSDDGYLVFYEENQAVVYWGIKENELDLENPPVYGTANTESPEWYLQAKTTEDFLLLMAIYNGTFGGLKYNANSLDGVRPETVKYIEENWTEVTEISNDSQKVFTDDFDEVISLSFSEEKDFTGIFIGTSDQQRFDSMLDSLDVEWNYVSYEDDDDFEDE